MKNRRNSKVDVSSLKVSLKLFDSHGKVKTYTAGTKVRFRSKLLEGNWAKCFISVSYGKHLNNFGEMEEFLNEGEYTSKKEALKAFNAFIEG